MKFLKDYDFELLYQSGKVNVVEILARCGNFDTHRNKVWKPWQGVETLTHIETRCGNLDSHRNNV